MRANKNVAIEEESKMESEFNSEKLFILLDCIPIPYCARIGKKQLAI